MSERLLTPIQEKFLAGYTDPSSPTYSNALQSALAAGYSQEYAESITYQLPEWLSEQLGDVKLLKKAEKRLNQLLDLEPVTEEGKVDNQLIANQMKAVTLVAKGIGKNKYSERVENTGKDGGPIAHSITGFNYISPTQTNETNNHTNP